MSNRYPLQPGDVAPDFSDTRSSPEADRRSQEVMAPVSNPMRRPNAANDQDRPEAGRIWKVGQAEPNFTAPFPVIHMDGDNNGQPAQVHEIDIYAYGDGYDPTAPMRTRSVDNYTLDSDFDGHLN